MTFRVPDLEETLLHYGVDLHRARPGWFSILCPVHTDKVASCQVNLALGKIKCLACALHGNGLDLIQEIEGTGPAAQALADSLPEQGTGEVGTGNRRERRHSERPKYRNSRRFGGFSDRRD